MQKGMIKLSVLYPAGERKTFNMDYYCNTHIPLIAQLTGSALKGASVDEGVAGVAPGSAPPILLLAIYILIQWKSSFNHLFHILTKYLPMLPIILI